MLIMLKFSSTIIINLYFSALYRKKNNYFKQGELCNERKKSEIKPFEGKSILKEFEKLKEIKELQDKEGGALYFPKYPSEIKHYERK